MRGRVYGLFLVLALVLVALPGVIRAQNATTVQTGSLAGPRGLAFRGDTLLVSDSDNNRIQKITPDGTVTTILGDGEPGSAANQLNFPVGIATDSAGNLYIADAANQRIQKLTPAGVVSTVAGGNGEGNALNQLSYPFGVTVAGNGDVYVADKDNDRIIKFVPPSTNGTVVWGGTGNGAAANQLNRPVGVLVVDGALYVDDGNNNRIQKVLPTGAITILGLAGIGAGTNQLNGPSGITLDGEGNLYIADAGNHRIQKLSPGGTVTTFLGGNSFGNASNQLIFPRNTTIKGDTLYIADAGNNRIQKIALTQSSGPSPQMTVSSSSVLFGSILLNQTGTQHVTVGNTGNSVLTLSSVDVNQTTGSGFAVTTSMPLDVPAGETRDISMTFTPTSVGSKQGTVSITHNAANLANPYSVGLSGNGTNPSPLINYSPKNLSFPSVSVGNTYTARATLGNTGTGTLIITSLSIANENPAGQFSAGWEDDEGNNNSQVEIAPGHSKHVSVTFGPTSAGNKSANLQIIDNAGGSPHLIPLSGGGVVGGSDHPVVVMLTQTLNFGDVPLGHADSLKAYVVNTGTADLYGHLAFVGVDSLQFSTEGDSGIIAPGDTADIGIRFSPSSLGTKSATLVLTGRNEGPFFVGLVGNGIESANDRITLKLGVPYAEDSPAGFIAPSFGAPGDVVDIQFGLLNPTEIPVGGLQFMINLAHAADQDKVDLVGIVPSEELLQHGFALYSNSNLQVVNPGGETVPAIRIVVAPQTNDGIPATALPPGNLLLGSLRYRIGHAGQVVETKVLSPELAEINLLGTTVPFELDHDIRISDEYGLMIPSAGDDRDAAIHVGIRGDVSLDGEIDVRDVVLEVRAIVGAAPPQGDYVYHQPISTAFLIADLHTDGVLDVLDAIAQINHILDLTFVGTSKSLVNAPTRPVGVSLGALQTLPSGGLAIPVTLDMDGQLAGAQFTVTFDPTQLTVGTPQPTGSAVGLTLDSHMKDGKLTLVLYSLQPTRGLMGGPVALIPVTVRDGASEPTLTLAHAVLGTRAAQAAGIHLTGNVVKVGMAPKAFALKGNSPNPFNPSTTIAYEVPQAAHITLTVYNLLGQEVVTLVNEAQAVGRYTVQWNARNASGTAVSSGVYLYRLTSSTGFTATHRMTLLK